MIAAVIPTHNGAAWLGEALRSVREQGDLVAEIVVVDDGSTDDTAAILRAEPDVIVVEHPQARGPAAARNAGVRASTAPLLAFLDVDDLWTRDALEQRLALMRDGGCDLVATRVFAHPLSEPLPAVPRVGSGFWTFHFGAALVTRDSWSTIGPIDESILAGEDVDWWLRARASGVRVCRSDLVTLVFRTHADSTLGTLDARRTAVFDVIRRRVADHG